ncbi:uracil-DNA glycosylase [Rurimicrobium arvi]|uniref:Uracil-DNA glycosylase n=1 Tax=Rurimicrobium arvi TaxID=2049916 RepID=A0ABP8N4M2_9BACT
MAAVKIEESWKEQLAKEFEDPYFAQLSAFLKQEKQAGKTIYPAGPDIFRAFNTTPFDKVSVVLLGQDPYHNPGQAHGLSFSVPQGVPPPPSLVNIFKELHQDTGMPVPRSGDLTPWAEQGVLLLNAALTVEAHKANSHANIGWHRFTDAVIHAVAEKRKNIVFLLWGRFAQSKAAFIDPQQHLILKAAHPSPLSAHNGFFGCRHFSKTNEYLAHHNKKPIDWNLS